MTLWLSLCMAVVALVMERNIHDVRKDLTQYGDAYSDHLDKKLVSSETILKGFSALFGAVGSTDQAKASRYVWQVIQANPQIFALKIVQSDHHRPGHRVNKKTRNPLLDAGSGYFLMLLDT